MGMRLCPALMDMPVRMNMRVFVRVNQTAMAVFMCVRMRMLVRVLQADAVLYHQHRTHGHDPQRYIKSRSRPFPQKRQAEGHAQKRSQRVVGACLGGPQMLLSHDIQFDAQPVSHKA